MGRAGNKVYIYGDGLDGNVTVNFGDTPATVIENSATEIVTTVPENATPGYNDITVTKDGATSNSFTYNVLSGDQNQVIFHVQAETNYGENIYIVGNIPELGNWDPDNCTEALLNPNYPEWFLPVSVPAGTQIVLSALAQRQPPALPGSVKKLYNEKTSWYNRIAVGQLQ